MNLLYLGSHAILEYDQVRLWSDLGYNVFSIGAYTNPHAPEVDTRPALPEVPYHPQLHQLVIESRERHAGQPAGYPVIDWAKYDLHRGLIDWADTIIVDCFPESWIASNWGRIRDKRVIWRTIGQSGPDTEATMQRFVSQGLQVVRYSPNERVIPGFAGESALIRFGKDPADWHGWTGYWTVYRNDLGPVIGATGKGEPFVGNVTQNMAERGEACGLDRWKAATAGLAAVPAGPGSEALAGVGSLVYDQMRDYLRGIRAYLYVGTVPASFTLGLIEAMLTGVPVVSVRWQTSLDWLFRLWEADTILPRGGADVHVAATNLGLLLKHHDMAKRWGDENRERAIELFSAETIGRQWLDFLGNPAVAEFQRTAVTA
jgi:glycosyltransferase involved in cell wall biosynthesis